MDSKPAMIVKILQTGMSLAAVMLLLPRMVKILMEGLIPVSEAAREFVQRHAGSREINIGLDSAILIGHPAAISSSLILVPIAILLSVVLPGNRVILFADLAVIPFLVAMAAPVVNGNIFRMVIIGTVTLAVGFYVANALAPLFTASATAAGFKLPENAAQITSIVDGFLWISWVVVEVASWLGVFGLIGVAIVIAASIALFTTHTAGFERLAGQQEELQAGE
jgi:PTS system galactitol-specific IIC component